MTRIGYSYQKNFGADDNRWWVIMFETQIDDELRLRTFCEDDAETLFRVVDENRVHLREWLPWLDANITSNDSLAFIQATLRQEADNQGFTCAVEFRGRVVGVAGYHPIRWYNKSVEIGVFTNESGSKY